MACTDASVPAIDVPFVKLDDAAGLADECRKVRTLGFASDPEWQPTDAPRLGRAK